jgi:hypothetical protein
MQSGLTLIIALFLSVSVAFSQQGIITGKITDASNNQVLIGATISIKNSKVKTSSDVDGTYHIGNLAAGEYTLEISYIGYATKHITEVNVVNGKVVTLNITLDMQSTYHERCGSNNNICEERNAKFHFSYTKKCCSSV